MRLLKLFALIFIVNLSGCMSYFAHNHQNGKYSAEIFGGVRIFSGAVSQIWTTALSDISWFIVLLAILDFPFSFITDILLLPYDSILNFIEAWRDFYS